MKAIREAALVEGNSIQEQKLVASIERLREEIAIANGILDELLRAIGPSALLDSTPTA
jgi:hypothetical protein